MERCRAWLVAVELWLGPAGALGVLAPPHRGWLDGALFVVAALAVIDAALWAYEGLARAPVEPAPGIWG